MDNNNLNNNVYPSSNSNVGNGYTQPPIQPQQTPNMNNGYTEPPIQNLNSNNYTNITPEKKSNKNIKKILLIVVAILVVGGVAFAGYKFFTKDKDNNKEFDITQTTAFFLQDANSKYALFNEDGKQLTEFIYTRVGSFVNGTATVETAEGEGIINAEGKLTVPIGKYKYISSSGGLYEATESTEESYNKYLINGSGKVLYDLDEITVRDFIGADTYSILEYEKENKYTVINYEGKELVSFPKVDDDEVDDPSTNEQDNYISVYYNNKNWIFNVVTGKQVASFDSELHYCVNNISEDENIITLNSCVSWFQSQDQTYYKFIKDGKLYDKTGECDKVTQNQGNLFCHKDYDEYLLDSNLNVGIETSGKAYNNSNSYVMNNSGSFNGVDFYQNGKVVKNVSCRTLKETGYMKSDIYILGTYYSRDCGTESGTYDFYKSNGEKLIEKSFARAEKFDSNGLAKVSEDKTNYYLIDKNGKQVGGSYSNISLSSDYYVITKDELKGIMDKEGNEILPCTYSRIDITTRQNKKYAKLTTSDSKYIIYDLNNKKEVFSLDASPNTNYEHYITTSSNGKTQYYTYSGKMFYEK